MGPYKKWMESGPLVARNFVSNKGISNPGHKPQRTCKWFRHIGRSDWRLQRRPVYIINEPNMWKCQPVVFRQAGGAAAAISLCCVVPCGHLTRNDTVNWNFEVKRKNSDDVLLCNTGCDFQGINVEIALTSYSYIQISKTQKTSLSSCPKAAYGGSSIRFLLQPTLQTKTRGDFDRTVELGSVAEMLTPFSTFIFRWCIAGPGRIAFLRTREKYRFIFPVLGFCRLLPKFMWGLCA